MGTRRWVSGTAVLLMAVLVVGCGGGGGGGPSTGSVAGYVMAPDGTTPVVDAYVYIPTAAASRRAVPFDYTDQYGYFRIDNVPAGPQTLAVNAGPFHYERSINVTGGQVNLVAPQDNPITMGGGGGTQVKMAVAAGYYDAISDVLDRLGFPRLASPDDPGTGYVLYGEVAPTPPSFGSGDISPVLSDTALLAKYHIIFLNCGTDESAVWDPTLMANLRAWIEAGGFLYVSDLAYDFVEVAYPDAVDFYGDDAVRDSAERGVPGQVTADVLDSGRQAALGKNTAQINFNLGSWAIIDGVGTGTDNLMRANVQAYDLGLGSVSDHRTRNLGVAQLPLSNRPILVRFRAGQGGVIYTSFHNEAQTSADMDKILDQLVFHF